MYSMLYVCTPVKYRNVRLCTHRETKQNARTELVSGWLQPGYELASGEYRDGKVFPGMEDMGIATDQVGSRSDQGSIYKVIIAGGFGDPGICGNVLANLVEPRLDFLLYEIFDFRIA